MWALGVTAYCIAVFHRASLGVAGPLAQQRFGATAAVLSLFIVLQLAVYASLQVPVGVALDRVGSRRMIAAGAVMMAAGQIVLAESHTVGLAVLGRVLVGTGDAMTFTSVLRLVAAWFPPHRVPVVTQFSGLLGQLGPGGGGDPARRAAAPRGLDAVVPRRRRRRPRRRGARRDLDARRAALARVHRPPSTARRSAGT